MRGIRFGFVPTSLLAMVDASIGGKNGIDVGVYKNMVGLIRQPAFLLFDIILFQNLYLKTNGRMVLQRSLNMPVSKMQQCLRTVAKA
jgi:3-dehydroquinate synthetase